MPDADTVECEASTHLNLGSRLVSMALSLQCKATVLVAGLTLCVTAGVSGYFLRAGANLVRDEQRARIVQLASMLSQASAKAVADRDTEELEKLADKVTKNGPLEYVVFTRIDGRRLAGAERRVGSFPSQDVGSSAAKSSISGAPVYRASAEAHSPFLDITYPVNFHFPDDPSVAPEDARLVGYLHTGLLANGWHRSMSSTLDLVVGVGIIAIVVAIPLGFLLVRRIISPLEVLGNAMLRFSRGELDVRSPTRRKDEIGKLAEAFNKMADQHQQSHERVVGLNAELENRVKQRTRQLRELASREPLTGLFNRRRFNEVLERSFAEAHRYDNELSCIMMDLDDFKNVNDRFGHQVGDELLVFTAGIITSQLRSTDFPARFGGDEFIVLLPQTDVERAQVLGQRIIERFAKKVAERFPHLRVGMSMGISSLRSLDRRDIESLVRAADRAMYESKAAGTNLVSTAKACDQAAPV